MINTDDAPSHRSADATAPFAPKAQENPFQDAKIKSRIIDATSVAQIKFHDSIY